MDYGIIVFIGWFLLAMIAAYITVLKENNDNDNNIR